MAAADSGAVVVDLGVKALRPWVQKLINEAVHAEQERASADLNRMAEELQKLMTRSLQQTIEGFERALGEECDLRRKELDEVTSKLQEEGQARRAALQAHGDRLADEQRQRAADEQEIAAKVAEEGRAWRSELSGAEAKLTEARKLLGEELSKQMAADHEVVQAAVKSARKDAKERVQEVEARTDSKLSGAKEELSHQAALLDSRIDDLSKDAAKAHKAAEALRGDDKAEVQRLLAEERRDLEALVSKEASARKAELLVLEEKHSEDSRRRQEDVAEELQQHRSMIQELDGRVTREARDRASEAAQLRTGLEGEASVRKSLADAHHSTERQLAKQVQEFAAHKAAVNAALGSKGSAQDMIAVAQALDQKSREADDKMMKTQDKLMAAVQAEKKARKEAVAAEHSARRAEVAELGSAVGLDVAKLHDTVAQQLEAERKARDSMARKIASERSAAETGLSAELSRVAGRLTEQSGRVDAYYSEFSAHQKAVTEALGGKGSATDLIAVAQALEQRAKDADKQNAVMRKELEDRYNKLASALRESCNALNSQHHEHVGKIEKALGSKGGAEALVEVQEALDRKADAKEVAAELEAVEKKLRAAEAELEARQSKGRAALEAAIEELRAHGDAGARAGGAELEALREKVSGALEDLESNLSQTDMGLNALKDAVDSHADSMDAFSADMANTVAKKLSTMQRALDGKVDFAAAASCVHIHSYMKDKGIKTPTSAKKSTGGIRDDTARLSMENISEMALMRSSPRRGTPSPKRSLSSRRM